MYKMVNGEPVEMTPDEIAAFEASQFEIEYVPSTPALIATAMVQIDDGAIVSVSVSAALAGIMQFGTGEYWAFFVEPQPDTDYMVLAYNGGTHRTGVASADKAETHFIIRATDFDGNPADPDCVNVEVKRVL